MSKKHKQVSNTAKKLKYLYMTKIIASIKEFGYPQNMLKLNIGKCLIYK